MVEAAIGDKLRGRRPSNGLDPQRTLVRLRQRHRGGKPWVGGENSTSELSPEQLRHFPTRQQWTRHLVSSDPTAVGRVREEEVFQAGIPDAWHHQH